MVNIMSITGQNLQLKVFLKKPLNCLYITFHGCDEQFAYNISERLIFAYLSAIMASFPFFFFWGGGAREFEIVFKMGKL